MCTLLDNGNVATTSKLSHTPITMRRSLHRAKYTSTPKHACLEIIKNAQFALLNIHHGSLAATFIGPSANWPPATSKKALRRHDNQALAKRSTWADRREESEGVSERTWTWGVAGWHEQENSERKRLLPSFQFWVKSGCVCHLFSDAARRAFWRHLQSAVCVCVWLNHAHQDALNHTTANVFQ